VERMEDPIFYKDHLCILNFCGKCHNYTYWRHLQAYTPSAKIFGFLGSNCITQKATEHFVAPGATKSSTQIELADSI
jgi:hypothetical protein